MAMRQKQYQCANYSEEKKLLNFMKYQEELSQFACLVSKLAIVCIRKGIPLVIENPYSKDHYLCRYWPVLPAIIDENRREFGDRYEKPTQYFFFGCEPLQNLIMDEPTANYPKWKVTKKRQKERSLISPEYARRFIRTYLKPYDAKDAEIKSN